MYRASTSNDQWSLVRKLTPPPTVAAKSVVERAIDYNNIASAITRNDVISNQRAAARS
jgi:hypothetical protein